MRLFGTPAKTRFEDKPVELTLVTPKPRALEAPIGAVYLQKYKLRRFLGEGSNAHVYLATDIADPTRKVCIKRIKDSAAQAPRFEQFFQAEVRSMSKFAHPYCVRLLDASLTDPLGPGLVMEYIEGITLEALFNAGGRIQHERLAKLIGPLGHGLYAAQMAGIAHRDLKPANLMVVDPGTDAESLKIMDFGFAGFTAKPHIQLAELTGEGGIHACGTPAYVSPEMIRGDSTDARADIYSVGVILYEMLTGRLPFDYNDTQKLLNAHVRETPPKFSRIGVTNVPPAVEQVIQQALSKFPSERQPNMKELVDQYSKAIGWDIWKASTPLHESLSAPDSESLNSIRAATVEPHGEGIDERFVLSDKFEACLPEKLAAIKLKGFVDEIHGTVVESEPGIIRLRVEMPNGQKEPTQRSAVFAFLSGTRRVPLPGKEPIEIQLKMDKLDANRVAVLVAFHPLKMMMPTDPGLWGERCEAYYSLLRKFVMPEG